MSNVKEIIASVVDTYIERKRKKCEKVHLF